MIGSWLRSKQQEELNQLKIHAEVCFNKAIDEIKIINENVVIRLHSGCGVALYSPDTNTGFIL